VAENGIAVPAEDESVAVATLLEDGERPAPTRDGLPFFRTHSPEDCLEYAAEIAADMETGFYAPEGEDTPWPKKTFVIREILRRMGYSPSYVDHNRRPMWWPDGGTSAFKGYVEWKVRERQMFGKVSYDKVVPYMEALTFMGFSELARRIKLAPEQIPFRDLSQFTLRGMELIKSQGNPMNGAISADGGDAYASIGKALEGVGDETARRAIGGLFDALMVEAQKKMRRVVEIPAVAS
jgi:hypothetical protein